jgi:transposase-like protein
MSKRKRRNQTAPFEEKVALAAVKAGKTLAQLAQHFDVHANQITDWKGPRVEEAACLFGASEERLGLREACLRLPKRGEPIHQAARGIGHA